jgi:hypothetical protein
MVCFNASLFHQLVGFRIFIERVVSLCPEVAGVQVDKEEVVRVEVVYNPAHSIHFGLASVEHIKMDAPVDDLDVCFDAQFCQLCLNGLSDGLVSYILIDLQRDFDSGWGSQLLS